MSNPILFSPAPASNLPPVGGGVLTVPPAKFINADYTLLAEDLLGILVSTATDEITITIPAGLPNGWVRVVQGSTGQIIVEADSNVMLTTEPGKRAGTNGEGRMTELLQLTPTQWAATPGIALAPSAPDTVYYGASASPTLTATTIQSVGVALAASGLPVSVAYDNTGGRYPFFAHPAIWGSTMTAHIGAFVFSDLEITEVPLSVNGGTLLYRVLRFRGLQNSNNLQVSWP